MPTGYTAGIEDGSITSAKDFLMLCTRAFGIAMDIRDEPLTTPTPLQFKPNKRYVAEYEEQLAYVSKVRNMTFEEMREEYLKYYNDSLLSKQHFVEMMRTTNEKYYPFLRKITNWNPPEAYNGIKEFAIEQIKLCMYNEEEIEKHQLDLDYFESMFDDSEQNIIEFHESMVNHEVRVLNSKKQKMDEDLQNSVSRTQFMQEFVKSLEDLE